jgi:FkbM family methyltransferase
MSKIPKWARTTKHTLFSILPGHIGLRNKACLHHLKKKPLDNVFTKALSEVQAGDILIDCGANVGSITKKFSNTEATVYSFEPDPRSFAQLAKSIGEKQNVHLYNTAVGIEKSTISFYRDSSFMQEPDHASLASSVFPRRDRPQEKITVDVIDFLDFVRKLPQKVSILKMDIEGAEVAILEQLFLQNLVQRFKYIFVETHELQFPELLERTWSLREQAATTFEASVFLDWH